MLKSLRDGTVPEKGVEPLTVGRSGWLCSLRQDLADVATGEKQVRVINGRYGDGKTHLMAVLREMALREGLAVSFVTVKPDVPLSRWDLLYKAVVTSLESNARRGAGGLAGLIAVSNPDPQIAETFSNKARSVRSVALIDSSFARAVYGYATGQAQSFVDPEEDMLIFRSWLEGNAVSADARRPLGLQTNIDRSNAHRMFQSLVGVLRHFGYPGLLLLLDEVESTLAQRANIREAAYDNLRSLVDRRDLPPGSFVVCSVTPEMFSDDDRGIRSYEALWQRLKPVGDHEGANFEATVADLAANPLTATNYREIGERIRAVHAIANDWEADRRVTDDFLTEAGRTAAQARSLAVAPTRILVKVVIDELDRAHANQQYVPDVQRLPVMFDRVARELSEVRSREEWHSS
jgi:hypothetical protein